MKEIIVKLAHDVEDEQRKNWDSIPLERFLRKDPMVRSPPIPMAYHVLKSFRIMATGKTISIAGITPSLTAVWIKRMSRYMSLFLCHANGSRNGSLAEEGFSRSLILRLVEILELRPLSGLTPNEQAHLSVLIQTTLEVKFSSTLHPSAQKYNLID